MWVENFEMAHVRRRLSSAFARGRFRPSSSCSYRQLTQLRKANGVVMLLMCRRPMPPHLCCTGGIFILPSSSKQNTKKTKIIKQLNHSVNAGESTGISNRELNINCSHTTLDLFLS